MSHLGLRRLMHGKKAQRLRKVGHLMSDRDSADRELGNPLDSGMAEAVVTSTKARAVVLVEGSSDRAALEALATRQGRDLEAEGISILPIGGATNIGHYLDLLGPRGLGVQLAGLCDAGEEGDFRNGLERSGVGADLTREDMAALGFFVCVLDLEDELIRSLGPASVEQVVEDQGDLGSFRIFQMQLAQRGRPVDAQLRRFMGTRSGRKINYARLLVEALELTQMPPPLAGVLAYVW